MSGRSKTQKSNVSEDERRRIPGYKILGKVGTGAMAVVYKAVQLSLDRIVAIKLLPKRFSENPEYLERFYREGRAAAKLNHPNIVQAIDVGEAGGCHYFVMEYVEGKTIADDISAGNVFGEEDALKIIIQVARALKHAHDHGVIHRDVKPKNIMISNTGQVKLADLGLAREVTDTKAAQFEAGKAYGTPYYISPEQIRGMVDLDGRADIYSLGAAFYHMVTGQVPFSDENNIEIMRKHLRERIVPPDHINTSLSQGVGEVIEVMMAKNRENRYNDVDELLIDLELLLQGDPPLHARKKFDVKELQTLENGELLEEDARIQEIRTQYRSIILTMVAILGISVLLNIILILSLVWRTQ